MGFISGVLLLQGPPSFMGHHSERKAWNKFHEAALQAMSLLSLLLAGET